MSPETVTIRHTPRTHGLRPAIEAGPIETAIGFNSWNGTITTENGNLYSNGDYLVVTGNVHALPDTRYQY